MTAKKKKPGRPALSKERFRGQLITVRFTPEEKEAFEKAAAAKGLTLSNWVRWALTSKIRPKGEIGLMD